MKTLVIIFSIVVLRSTYSQDSHALQFTWYLAVDGAFDGSPITSSGYASSGATELPAQPMRMVRAKTSHAFQPYGQVCYNTWAFKADSLLVVSSWCEDQTLLPPGSGVVWTWWIENGLLVTKAPQALYTWRYKFTVSDSELTLEQMPG
jgi:hypothetical protein